ncbi:hypothetical protein [Paenibacillus odorifer]|uniref:hypothetical protein n=1 Tax=Paenibacillus odorifer TaxID=189426 RepID=UPI00096FAC9F|nr:hypothetical protein [Paenibacillus odorifer]OMD16239.1 hypothetical protein BJP50_18555 [Paenibacillus odorifer]
MKTDVLTVVETGYDDGTAFYVNGESAGQVAADDSHETPELLYGLITRYNFARVDRRMLTDDARDRTFDDGNYEYPELLSAFAAEDFET